MWMKDDYSLRLFNNPLRSWMPSFNTLEIIELVQWQKLGNAVSSSLIRQCIWFSRSRQNSVNTLSILSPLGWHYQSDMDTRRPHVFFIVQSQRRKCQYSRESYGTIFPQDFALSWLQNVIVRSHPYATGVLMGCKILNSCMRRDDNYN